MESSTCRAAHLLHVCARTQNNQPIGSPFFWTCPSSLASLNSWVLWILLCTLLFYWSLSPPFNSERRVLKKSGRDVVWLCFCLTKGCNHPRYKQGCAPLWFPPLHEWFGYIFPLWNFVHTVVSPLRNMAYFLLQMSSLRIYLLNCKGRKIIHISVIRHARNTSQNPIRLVIKKEKAAVWYYVDLKALPEGFYSLIISGFFSLFWLE